MDFYGLGGGFCGVNVMIKKGDRIRTTDTRAEFIALSNETRQGQVLIRIAGGSRCAYVSVREFEPVNA